MTQQDRRIRLISRRLIEAEISHYHETLQELQELEEEFTAPTVRDFTEPHIRSGPSDPTPTKAIQMITSTELLELRRRVAAIERMLWILKAHPEPERYELIKLTYWSNGRYSVASICQELNISESTYHRWKKEALEIVAEKLGWRV
ncbi:MAG: DUF1492 domain-containing protein [Firmicutes bacterium]|jgi:RinA family phage transcriptional activator|nr:DUF1492 domain-containing protein [Bacillota bacterium]